MKAMVPSEDAWVVIVGLAKGCESDVASKIRRIDSAFTMFRERSWNVHGLQISPFRHFVRSLESTVLAGLAVLRGLSRSFNRRG